MKTDFPKFDENQLLKYNGVNPFIIELKQKTLDSSKPFVLSEFENEYLINNFRYCGYSFEKMKISVGKITEARIQKEFNVSREISEILMDCIVGETEQWYHVSSPSPNGRVYMWLYKEEVGNLYEKVYTNHYVDFEPLDSLFGLKLKDHQKIGIQFLSYNPKSYLFDTVGNGKTHTSIGASLAVNAQRVLIVCLSGKKIDWKRELAVWNQDCKIIKGEKGWISDQKRYTIINFDIIQYYYELKTKTKATSELYRPLLDEKFDCIIIDEVQKIKSADTNVSKVLSELTAQKSVKYIWGLSATPVERNLEYLQLCLNLNMDISDLILSPANHHFTKWFSKLELFKERYCYGYKTKPKNGTKPFWVLGKKINGIKVDNSNTHELHQRVKHLQLRRRTENSIEGFPEKTRSRLYQELTSKERQEYEELFDNYVKTKEIISDSDVVLSEAFKYLKGKMDNVGIDRLHYKYINQLSELKKRSEKFNDGHEKLVISYIDSSIERLKKAVENKRNIEDFEPQVPKDLEKSRMLIERIILRQYLAIKKVPHTIHSVKSDNEDGKNCIIFTHFKEEFRLLSKGLAKNSVIVKSGNAEKIQETVDEYMTNPKMKNIIGHIESLGTGLNITKADHVYFNSPNENGGKHLQAEGRTWRMGRVELVEVFYQLFDNTIEEVVFENAESKKDNTALLFGEITEKLDN